MSLEELAIYVAVVRDGSFTAAADSLGIDKARVSRVVSRLEEKLGARLLERSTRQLRVTEVGTDVYERATGILLAVESTEAAVARRQQEPQGTLRISAGPEMGKLLVNDWITSYLRAYPDMRIETEYSNRLVDIIHEGFDVAVRVGPLPDSELSARKLGENRYGLYASPAYLARCGTPETIADLKTNDLIMFAPRGQASWTLVNSRNCETVDGPARCKVDSTFTAVELVRAGFGIALLPYVVAHDGVARGDVVQILPDWSRIPVPIHAVFASSRYMNPAVRAFVDIAIRDAPRKLNATRAMQS